MTRNSDKLLLGFQSESLSPKGDKMTKFVLDQNNAGGYFLEGMPQMATIVAETRAEAETIAKNYGIDFSDGCPGCCGDRWSVYAYDPMFHGENLPDLLEFLLQPVE